MMTTLAEVARDTKTITFDCYGTLIDWDAGLRRSLRDVFGSLSPERDASLFETYVDIEAEVEAEPFRDYRDVLAEVVRRLARRFGVEVADSRVGALAEQLPSWPPFVDTNAALLRLKKKYRLGILSNVDRDLFSGTGEHFDAALDFVVTAQDVGSYKPSHGHFDRLLGDHAERSTVLHVAQSLFHDGVPADELGIAFVWINRYNEAATLDVPMVSQFSDLESLADALCLLVARSMQSE